MGPPDGFRIRRRADKFRPSKDDKKKFGGLRRAAPSLPERGRR
jgi:hypothetical protein